MKKLLAAVMLSISLVAISSPAHAAKVPCTFTLTTAPADATAWLTTGVLTRGVKPLKKKKVYLDVFYQGAWWKTPVTVKTSKRGGVASYDDMAGETESFTFRLRYKGDDRTAGCVSNEVTLTPR